MDTLPSLAASAGEQRTGLTCPDCQGTISVTAEGSKDTLRFQCRIGHAYATEEMIAGKDGRVEDLLWAALTALEEVAGLLIDLVEKNRAGPQDGVYRERAARTRQQQELLRQAIALNAPTTVDTPVDPESKRS